MDPKWIMAKVCFFVGSGIRIQAAHFTPAATATCNRQDMGGIVIAGRVAIGGLLHSPLQLVESKLRQTYREETMTTPIVSMALIAENCTPAVAQCFRNLH